MSKYTDKHFLRRFNEVYASLSGDITVRLMLDVMMKNPAHKIIYDIQAVSIMLYRKFKAGELVKVGKLHPGNANVYRKRSA